MSLMKKKPPISKRGNYKENICKHVFKAKVTRLASALLKSYCLKVALHASSSVL